MFDHQWKLEPSQYACRKSKRSDRFCSIEFAMSSATVSVTLNRLFPCLATVYQKRGQDQLAQTGGAISVNDLMAEPAGHLSQIRLVGVVAAVSQGTGFVLVDKQEYAECGISCISESGTKKIPVRWSGDAPKLAPDPTRSSRPPRTALTLKAAKPRNQVPDRRYRGRRIPDY